VVQQLGGTETVGLSRDPRSLAAARHWVADALSDQPGAIVDVVMLLTDELVANVLDHTDSDPLLRLTLAPDRVRVEVHDAVRTSPVLRETDLWSSRGRGLQIVDGCAGRWGVEPTADGGKYVWFETGLAPVPTAADQPMA